MEKCEAIYSLQFRQILKPSSHPGCQKRRYSLYSVFSHLQENFVLEGPFWTEPLSDLVNCSSAGRSMAHEAQKN